MTGRERREVTTERMDQKLGGVMTNWDEWTIQQMGGVNEKVGMTELEEGI